MTIPATALLFFKPIKGNKVPIFYLIGNQLNIIQLSNIL